MSIRPLAVACLCAAGSSLLAQTPQHLPDRAIRRDIPLTNSIRRAFAAGTRDSTGRPGRHYWQLWMDYTIHARLDAPASTIQGRETIRLRNNSDSSLNSIQLRLDQNIFRGDVPRGNSVPAENHEGFVITKMSIDGTPVDLGAPGAPGAGRYGRGAAAAQAPVVYGLHSTSARLNLASPIAPHATATLVFMPIAASAM